MQIVYPMSHRSILFKVDLPNYQCIAMGHNGIIDCIKEAYELRSTIMYYYHGCSCSTIYITIHDNLIYAINLNTQTVMSSTFSRSLSLIQESIVFLIYVTVLQYPETEQVAAMAMRLLNECNNE